MRSTSRSTSAYRKGSKLFGTPWACASAAAGPLDTAAVRSAGSWVVWKKKAKKRPGSMSQGLPRYLVVRLNFFYPTRFELRLCSYAYCVLQYF